MEHHANDIQSLLGIDFTAKLNLFDGLNFDATDKENDALLRFIHKQLSNGEINQRFYQIVNNQSWELNWSDSETESESEMMETDGAAVATKLNLRHECSKCDQKFDRTWKIFAHMKADHANDEFMDKCSHCQQMYPNYGLLAKHLKGQCENAVKPFSCNSCGAKFMWKSSCDAHTEKLHPPDKSKTFLCDICER